MAIHLALRVKRYSDRRAARRIRRHRLASGGWGRTCGGTVRWRIDQVQRKMTARELQRMSMVDRMFGSRTNAGAARGKVQLG
jgi:hypothetical protein